MESKKIVGTWYDLFFISFPIWVPLLFMGLFSALPTQFSLLVLIAIFVLSETHFGATWFFFADKGNTSYLQDNKKVFVFIPLGIVVVLMSLWTIISFKTVFILSAAASAFHVTRQSIGVNKLYSSGFEKERQLSFFSIYFFSAFCLAIGFLRFYGNVLNISPYLSQIQILGYGMMLCFAAIVFFSSIQKNRNGKLNFVASSITGMGIYLPYLFVERIEVASVVGVGMHWVQYSALVLPIYFRKRETSSNFSRKILPILFMMALLGYGFTMVLLRQGSHGFHTLEFSSLYIIPLSLQALHYYYDAYIWRFSDSHIRKEVGKYVFASAA